jgi:hypothetical protein
MEKKIGSCEIMCIYVERQENVFLEIAGLSVR